jgi:flavin reductase (DIM6/NTAB) family NADH-FMN oxidoreductase RutF
MNLRSTAERLVNSRSDLDDTLADYHYRWPTADLKNDPRWRPVEGKPTLMREMPESEDELTADSRWPAFFPSPICLVSASDGTNVALEKVVGASIVNRFPYVIALSFCKQELSLRHHARRAFTDVLECGGCVAVQYLPPGPDLDRAMGSITAVPDAETSSRIGRTGLPVRKGITNDAPIFESAYMAYEARLARPGRDFEGRPIYQEPWVDVGSHRVYFLEINAIQLRQDIALGESQIHWSSLPAWQQQIHDDGERLENVETIRHSGYKKPYTPHYVFPSAGTAAFEFDGLENGMAVKHLPPLPEDQIEVDNDRARWPCFFPSSAGMITTWADDGLPNLMPCGSTTVLSRHPMIIAPCISYAAINQRYAPRATLDILRTTGTFGCGVPFIGDEIVRAIKYAGNTSIAEDPNKIRNSGLRVERWERAPQLSDLPVHFECEVRGEVRLGTHILFLGEVRRILVRADVTPENPLEWCPWAAVDPLRASDLTTHSSVPRRGPPRR